ncbi:MAG: ATP-dependent protease, partial [Candidimonas sp.]
ADAGWMRAAAGEASAVVRERVEACRLRQVERQGYPNARLNVVGIDAHCRLDAAASAMLRQAMLHWNWSARAVHRMLRVARTIADLDAVAAIGESHVAEAIQYRQPWR